MILVNEHDSFSDMQDLSFQLNDLLKSTKLSFKYTQRGEAVIEAENVSVPGEDWEHNLYITLYNNTLNVSLENQGDYSTKTILKSRYRDVDDAANQVVALVKKMRLKRSF